MRRRSTQSKVVIVALAANLGIALAKFTAAAITGSSAILSEGIHSLVDTINEVLLLYGVTRAAKAPDKSHPFGYGRELYFWSFVVSLLVLALGAGVSCYEGVSHLLDPHAIESPLVNYLVIAVSFLFEGISFLFTLRRFRATKGDQGYFEAFRNSKDPGTFTVLFEDFAALVGLAIAFAGILGSQILRLPQLDGIASLGIGVVLAISSLLLARETKALLIGEPAERGIRESIIRIASADAAVRHANGVITSQLGPQQIVAALSAEFEDQLMTGDIEACVNRIEDAIKRAHPDIAVLFVKPQTRETWTQRSESVGRRPGEVAR